MESEPVRETVPAGMKCRFFSLCRFPQASKHTQKPQKGSFQPVQTHHRHRAFNLR